MGKNVIGLAGVLARRPIIVLIAALLLGVLAPASGANAAAASTPHPPTHAAREECLAMHGSVVYGMDTWYILGPTFLDYCYDIRDISAPIRPCTTSIRTSAPWDNSALSKRWELRVGGCAPLLPRTPWAKPSGANGCGRRSCVRSATWAPVPGRHRVHLPNRALQQLSRKARSVARVGRSAWRSTGPLKLCRAGVRPVSAKTSSTWGGMTPSTTPLKTSLLPEHLAWCTPTAPPTRRSAST